MAINIRFLADIQNWVSGLGQAKDSLDENAEGLEQLMRRAVELGREIGKSTDDIARDFSQAFGIPLDRAKTAVEEVVAETEGLSDAADDAGKAGQDAGRKVADGMKDAADSTDDIKGATKDTGDRMGELGRIARDVLNGDFVSAAEGASDALGGIGKIAEVGGPIAVALGTLAGILGETLGAAAEEASKRTQAMFDDLAESGDKAISKSYALAAAQDLINNPEQLARAKRIADALGIELPDAILALVGDTEALTGAQGALEEKMSTDTAGKLAGKYNEASKAIGETSDSLDNAGSKAGILSDISARLDDTGSSADESSGKVQSLYDKLSSPPSVPPAKLKLDSSEIDNYRPRTLYIPARIRVGGVDQVL